MNIHSSHLKVTIDENASSGSMIVKRVEYKSPVSIDEKKNDDTQFDTPVFQDAQDPYDFGSDFELEVYKRFNCISCKI